MHAAPRRTTASPRTHYQELHYLPALYSSADQLSQWLVWITFREEPVVIVTVLTTLIHTEAQRHVRIGLTYVYIPLYIAPGVIGFLLTSSGRWYGSTREERIAFDYNGNLIIKYKRGWNDREQMCTVTGNSRSNSFYAVAIKYFLDTLSCQKAVCSSQAVRLQF